MLPSLHPRRHLDPWVVLLSHCVGEEYICPLGVLQFRTLPVIASDYDTPQSVSTTIVWGRIENIPSLMGFSAGMCQQGSFRIKPFGALYTIVLTEIGEVFRWLGILKPAEMLCRGQVSFYLIDIPKQAVRICPFHSGTVHFLPCLSSRLCDSSFTCDTHCDL